MGAFDDLLPGAADAAADAEEGGGAFDDLVPTAAAAPAKREVGFGEAAKRFASKGVAEASKRAGLALSAPAVLVDTVASLFSDQPTTAAQDVVFPYLVDPAESAVEANRLKPDEALTGGGTAGAIAGSFAGMLPDLALGAKGTGAASDAAVRVTDTLGQAIGRLLASGVAGSQPIAQTQALSTYDDLVAAGVDPDTAAKAAARQYAMDTISMAAPGAAAGGALARAGSGAAVNLAGGMAADQAVNEVLAENYPDQQRDLLDPTSRGAEGVLGGALGVLLGQRGGRAANRADLGYGRPEPTAEEILAQALIQPEARPTGEIINEAVGVREPVGTKERTQRRKEAAAAFSEGGPVIRRDEVIPADGELVSITGQPPEFARDRTGTAVPVDELARQREVEAIRGRGEDAEAFRIAEAQRRRKQDAQDRGQIVDAETGEPIDTRDLREARAGGTTTREGTEAVQPEAFTFLDAKIRDGVLEGQAVEVVQSGLEINGKPASRVQMPDGTVQVVANTRLTTHSRPRNPRYAQDMAATTYAPPRGVGTGEQQPQPRRAGQRITTEPSDTVYVGPERRRQPEPQRQPRQGEDVSDMAFDRIPRVEGVGTNVTVTGRPRGAPGNRLGGPREAPRLPSPDAEVPGGALRGNRRETYDERAARQRQEEIARYSREELGNTNPEAIAQRTRSQQAMEEERIFAAPPQRPGPPPPSRPKTRNLLNDIREWGGIGSALARDLSGEKGFRANSGFARLFRKDGLDIDDLATFMYERGWLNEQEFNDVDGGAQAARDLISRALRGEEVFHPGDIEAQARYEADQRAYNEAAQQSGLTEEDVPNVELVARAAEMDEAAVERAAIQYEDDVDGFMAEIRRILNERESAEAREGREAGQPAQDEEFTLRGETEQEIRDREAREAQERERVAEEERASEARDRADREREDFNLTGSDRAADANPNQRDLLESGAGTLRFGISPKDLADAFGLLVGDSKKWAQSLSNFWDSLSAVRNGGKPRENPIIAGVRAFFDTAVGDMRGALRKYNSPTAQWVLDQFSAEAGGKRAVGETFHDAVVRWSNQQINRFAKAVAGFENDKAAMAQIVALVREPSKIQPGRKIHDAAREVRRILDDALAYMKAAGVDVGEVKNGYFPREYDLGMVARRGKEFIQAAAQAYRESGMNAKDALESAKQLHNSLVFGDGNSIFQPSRGTPAAPFLKGRVFGKQVDDAAHPLNKFLVNDPRIAIPHYLQRVARRAETARRFGSGFEKWGEIKAKIIDEGAGDVMEKLEDFVAMAAGLRNPESAKGLLRLSSAARMWSTLMFLEKATLSSLSEFVTPAIRAGNIAHIPRSLKTTIQALAKAGDAERLRELGEDMGLLAGHFIDTFNAARFSGGDPVGQFQTRVLDAYFRRTGLTQWTEATRVGAIDVGQTFIRRLAKDLTSKRDVNLTHRYLAELGIPKEQAAAFARYVISKNDGRLSAGDIQGQMGELYRTALGRFMNQSIMAPDATTKPRWMSHPLGSVVGQLQSFNYAFWENVWKRNARLAVDAIKNEGGQYTREEQARMLLPMLMMPLLVGVAGAVGEARDALIGDPRKRAEETPWEKVAKAFSRGTPVAPLDPIVNWISGARYQRGAVESFSGPLAGNVARGLEAGRDLALKNSPRTNTTERAAARAVYDLVVEPSVNLLLTATPVAPASATITQVVGSGRVRDAFMEAVAGPPKRKDDAGPDY